MSKIRGVIVDKSAPGSVRLAQLEAPVPLPHQALIRVSATSLNRGEIRRATTSEDGSRIGWDFAGTVERHAVSGMGPAAGTRVVGMLPTGAWAELIAAPTEALAALPEEVSFVQAATLPVAGLTALYGLEKASGLLGRRVLITGGTGGVGHFAIQLGRLGGAHVIATVRSEDKSKLVRDAGAHAVVVGESAQAVAAHGPYDIILDGVGGAVLAAALGQLGKDGICVVYGATSGTEINFNLRSFYSTGGARIYGFILFHEFGALPAGIGLSRLLRLLQKGSLRPPIDIQAPIERISELAQDLTERKFTGKAVLTFG
jgi:NADPH:quinone reductase-like Zn-dependent oxidoreductase